MSCRSPRTRCLTWTAALTVCFVALLAFVLASGAVPFDRRIDDALHSLALAHPGWTRLNLDLTNWVWAPATMRLLTVAAAAVLLRLRERRQALWVLAACGVGWALEVGVKAAVGRSRPYWPHPLDTVTDGSLPSGHAMAATIACVTLAWLLRLHGVRGAWWTSVVGLGTVSVLGVGFTRLYVGVHWLSDVLAGWLLGTAVVTASAAALTPWRRSRTA
ncbi:phosphatase PAP2 family protein [Streptantibioticus ferralitis]|uniref:Phosphatase PAP2 family protein n=1 Tax=Streptantibioticus ferralitis TaxID=236510 RepID=A0ABT5YXN5_9ACTN|nr:phosphatase PAP2 family protein [Streptantibioticus ferralitis]MDF2256362.1 phosphatase PAP2 family protein [Streptantibioticus ferralitis]